MIFVHNGDFVDVVPVSVIEKIRAEIEQIKPWDYPCDRRTPEHIRDMALDIIDRYAEQEPCTDSVSRQAVLQELTFIGSEIDPDELTCIFRDRIEQLPSVRPQEQTGHWTRISMDRYTTHAQYWYECDKCGVHNLGNTDFCPNCGARMESEDKE